MSVLCDIDGVLADFDAAFRAAAEDVLGRQLEGPAQVWDLMDAYSLSWNEHKAIWDSPALLYHMELAKPYEGAQELTHRLPKGSIYCTARGSDLTKPHAIGIRTLTLRWLAKHGFADFPAHFTADKAAYAKATRRRYAIDDAPEQIEALRAAGLTVWVPTRAYNAHIGGRGVVRVDGCGEVMRLCATKS